jgi:dihydroceramidase
MQSSIFLSHVLSSTILLSVVIEARSILDSHAYPSDVKHFESKLDTATGYWSPSTSSIDWCERNYAVTQYIAEFWNFISSFSMCILAGILFIQGLYNRIEKRFLLLSLSFGFVGLGSAYFHGTLTYFGQMADEVPMVYSVIIWWFILFRIDKFKQLENKISASNMLIAFGIFYGFLWTYVHSLQTFVLIFQIHFLLMILGGIIKMIYLYRQTHYHTYCVKYLIMLDVGLLVSGIICWIIDQEVCERLNSTGGFNPQLHAWWHLICAVNAHIGIVCSEAMRRLSIKYQQHEVKNRESCEQSFKAEDHLHIVFYLGIPYVDYSNDKQTNKAKNQ